MLGAALGLLYANAGEWFIHRFVLHGLGKKKKSVWSFHWGEHHRASRKNDFFDPDYQRSVWGRHAQGKEALAVVGLMAAHAPLFAVAPWFVGAVWYSGLNYLYTHKKAHLQPEWAKVHLKHHYDHHMGLDQDKNWCVTRPWFDVLVGTRVDYQYDEQGRPKKPEQADLTQSGVHSTGTGAEPANEVRPPAREQGNDQKRKTAA